MVAKYRTKKITWDKYDHLVTNIVNKIKSQDLQIDTLVPILRGGAPLGLSLESNLNIPTSYLHIKSSLTNKPNSDFNEPKLLGATNTTQIQNKNILICEDVIATMRTLCFAIDCLKKLKPKNILISTLYDFSPRKDLIFGEKSEEQEWIIFPWEQERQ
jgi:hypoxanthine phosphoribosyltransferase